MDVTFSKGKCQICADAVLQLLMILWMVSLSTIIDLFPVFLFIFDSWPSSSFSHSKSGLDSERSMNGISLMGDDRLYVKNRSIAAVGHTSSVRPQTRLQCAVPDPFNYLHIYILPLFTYTSTTLRYVCQSFPIALLCCPTYAIGIQHTSFHNKFAYPQFRRCFRCCILH